MTESSFLWKERFYCFFCGGESSSDLESRKQRAKELQTVLLGKILSVKLHTLRSETDSNYAPDQFARVAAGLH